MDRRAVEEFYGTEPFPGFDGLLRIVNRQAVAPFFRPRVKDRGRKLDAGSGDGSLADELGLVGGTYVDLAREQVRRCRERLEFGSFVQADIGHLPFKADCFDQVICSNVLHYVGLEGVRELLRVTRKGGRLLLAFLEDSFFTRLGIFWGVRWGLFPRLMMGARLIDLAAFRQMGFREEESATISFLPPLIQAIRELPRLGFVAFELEK